MRRILCLIIIGMLGLAATGAAPLRADVVDKIAIIVNNEIITMSEIDRMLAPIYARYRTIYTDNRELAKKMQEARQRVVDQLIEDKLIISEAKKRKIDIDEKEIEAKLREVRKQFASKKEFTKALIDQHLTLRELKHKYHEQMMSRRLVDQKIGGRILVTPVEIHAYYNGHLEDFTRPGSVTARHILIKPADAADAERARALADEIEAKLAAGEDFAELAKAYSQGPAAAQGGLMEGIKKGDLMPQLEQPVFALEPGQVSGVIESPVGYHIFLVEEKTPERRLSIHDAYKEIEELIFREKISREMKDWIASLRKNAYIAFK